MDTAEDIGNKILKDMVGKTVAQHTLRKKLKYAPWVIKAVKIQEDVVYIGLKLLFQSLVTAGKYRDDLPKCVPT